MESTVSKNNQTQAQDNNSLQAQLEALRKENESLRLAKGLVAGGVTIKVTDKGGFSVYGLGRFPVTLYREQWTRLLDAADQVKAYIEANASDPKVVAASTAHETRKAEAKAEKAKADTVTLTPEQAAEVIARNEAKGKAVIR